MAERMGQMGAVGLAMESSWGVAAAATRYLEVTQADIRPVIGYEVPELVSATRARRRATAGNVVYAGPLRFDACAGGVGEILKAALGTVTTTLVSSTASGAVYQHAFTRANTTTLPSLTVEQNMGGLSAKQVVGVRINQLMLTLSPGRTLLAEADCRGKDEALISPTTPAYPTDDFLHYSGFSTQVDSAANTQIEDFELRLLNNLADDVWTAGAGGKLGRLPAGKSVV